MKFKGTLIGEASGSLAGITFSRNKGGQYIRQRANPTNPGTPQQSAIRSIVGNLSNLWVNTLTPAERDAWETYAANVLLPDAFGDPRQVSGLNMYIRSNTPRLQAGATRIDTAPGIFDLGEFTAPTFAAPSEATQDIDVSFTAADAWPDVDDAHMIIFASPPQNPTINYYKGPYRLAGTIDGDSTTAPTSPATINLPFAFVAGQRIFLMANVTQGDGRYGSPFRNFALSGA